jgi:hypothetical protein
MAAITPTSSSGFFNDRKISGTSNGEKGISIFFELNKCLINDNKAYSFVNIFQYSLPLPYALLHFHELMFIFS